MNSKQKQPFSSFGQALRELRQRTKESEMEVSGAVEIDLDRFQAYEVGATRPTEDILTLLIQHFGLKEQEASELWRLAGYGSLPEDSMQYFMNDGDGGVKPGATVAVNQEDIRIVYTDMVQVMVNNYGVIVNFMQGAGPGNSPLAVSRIGMSKEHAKSVIDVLKMTLEQSESLEKKPNHPKQLPSGKKNQN